MPKEIIMEPGSRYGRWIVKAKVIGGRLDRYSCECDCGTVAERYGRDLRRGHSQSCGCRTVDRVIIHGLSKVYPSEYYTWYHMIRRCTNPKHKGYERYGGRGITVCERWLLDFTAFLQDAGLKPSKEYSLDRINNDGNYEPGNVRWATRAQQQQNTVSTVLSMDIARKIREEYVPFVVTQRSLAEKYGVTHGAVTNLLNRPSAWCEATV